MQYTGVQNIHPDPFCRMWLKCQLYFQSLCNIIVVPPSSLLSRGQARTQGIPTPELSYQTFYCFVFGWFHVWISLRSAQHFTYRLKISFFLILSSLKFLLSFFFCWEKWVHYLIFFSGDRLVDRALPSISTAEMVRREKSVASLLQGVNTWLASFCGVCMVWGVVLYLIAGQRWKVSLYSCDQSRHMTILLLGKDRRQGSLQSLDFIRRESCAAYLLQCLPGVRHIWSKCFSSTGPLFNLCCV